MKAIRDFTSALALACIPWLLLIELTAVVWVPVLCLWWGWMAGAG